MAQPDKKKIYGVIVLLIAGLLLTSSLAMFYYFEYSQVSQSNNNLTTELASAAQKYNQTATNYDTLVSKYDSISSNYNGSITSFDQMASVYNQSVFQFNQLSSSFESLSQKYYTTFSLLSSTVAQLNTSDTSYASASNLLPQLWNQYVQLISNYRAEVAAYDKLFLSFNSTLSSFQSKNNSNLTLGYATPVKPISISLLTSDILIDFGNGTMVWYNDTSIQPGWNLYIGTLVVTGGNINATYYTSFSPAEHFVWGIDGTLNTNSEAWSLWILNGTSWQSSQVGADLLPMYNGSVYAWAFCGYNPSTGAPTCTP